MNYRLKTLFSIPIISFLLIVFVFICCSDDNSNEEITIEDEELLLDYSIRAQDFRNIRVYYFLEEVVKIMEMNSINRKKINWSLFRERVFERAINIPSVDNSRIDSILRFMLEILEDNHSFFRKPNNSFISSHSTMNHNCTFEDINNFDIPDNIGYVRIGGNFQTNLTENELVNQIQAQIVAYDEENIKGWIVDLRNNGGGNMWPMLTGIGPILGEGICGYFVDPDNNKQTWSFEEGKAMLSSNPVISTFNTYELKNPSPKVAVLVNSATSSSGEALFIAFKGRSNTKSFGMASCGLSTANLHFPSLSNGYSLFLTVSTMADRNLNLYGKRVRPDVVVDQTKIMNKAINFLNE